MINTNSRTVTVEEPVNQIVHPSESKTLLSGLASYVQRRCKRLDSRVLAGLDFAPDDRVDVMSWVGQQIREASVFDGETTITYPIALASKVIRRRLENQIRNAGSRIKAECDAGAVLKVNLALFAECEASPDRSLNGDRFAGQQPQSPAGCEVIEELVAIVARAVSSAFSDPLVVSRQGLVQCIHRLGWMIQFHLGQSSSSYRQFKRDLQQSLQQDNYFSSTEYSAIFDGLNCLQSNVNYRVDFQKYGLKPPDTRTWKQFLLYGNQTHHENEQPIHQN